MSDELPSERTLKKQMREAPMPYEPLIPSAAEVKKTAALPPPFDPSEPEQKP